MTTTTTRTYFGLVTTCYVAVRLAMRTLAPLHYSILTLTMTPIFDLRPFELKIGTPNFGRALENVHTNLGFLRHFFELGYRAGQTHTDGRTNGQDTYCGLLGRPHKKMYSNLESLVKLAQNLRKVVCFKLFYRRHYSAVIWR